MKKEDKVCTVLNKRMNRKDLSLDISKAEAIKGNLMKQLEIINKSFTEIDLLLNRLAMKNFIDEKMSPAAIQCAKKCASQAQAARSLMQNLDSKDNDDQKIILIQELDDRISLIEDKLSRMQ